MFRGRHTHETCKHRMLELAIESIKSRATNKLKQHTHTHTHTQRKRESDIKKWSTGQEHQIRTVNNAPVNK